MMPQRRYGPALLATIGVSLGVAGAGQGTSAPAILAERRALDEGVRHWRDRERHMKLTLERGTAPPQQRELVTYERHLAEGREQAILFFEAPSRFRGVGFLSFARPGHADEQWVYLPALKRVRQIGTSRSDREDQFAETDLTFEDLDLLTDMTAWSEAEAPSALLGEEVLDGVATYRIERTPRREDVYYSRVVLWIGKDDLVTRRVELFKGGPTPVKRIDEGDIRLVNAIPVAHRLEAATLTATDASRTIIEVSTVRFDQGLGDEVFSQRALQRGAR